MWSSSQITQRYDIFICQFYIKKCSGFIENRRLMDEWTSDAVSSFWLLGFLPNPTSCPARTHQLSSRENKLTLIRFNVKLLWEHKIKYWRIPQKIKTPPATSHSLLCGLQFHPGFPKEAKSIWRTITTWSINWTNDTVPLSPEMDASSWARALPRNE